MAIDLLKMVRKGQPKNPPRITMIGEEGVGKSTFAASAPSPLFMCSESGLVGTAFGDTSNVTPTSWTEAREIVASLIAGGHQFKTLVIDTLDWLEPLLFAFLCARDKKNGIEDYGYGKGYVVAADEFRLFLSDLERLNKTGVGIIILGHCQTKLFNNPIGDNYDRYEPKVTKQIAGLVREWSDVVLFARFKVYTHKEGRSKAKGVGDCVRVLQTTKSPAWDAKNRYGLPDELPMSWDAVVTSITAETPDTPEAIEAEISDTIEKSSMPDKSKQNAKAALVRDKGNVQALKILLNRVRQAA